MNLKQITSRISLILTAVALLTAGTMRSSVRPEECPPPEFGQPRAESVTALNGPMPTLAPPQKMVFVQVESDKLDIEVGWADN